jgi:hypothetical protein
VQKEAKLGKAEGERRKQFMYREKRRGALGN